MCLEHWRLVPQLVRDRVYDTLREHNEGGNGVKYLNAVRDAIAAVNRIEQLAGVQADLFKAPPTPWPGASPLKRNDPPPNEVLRGARPH